MAYRAPRLMILHAAQTAGVAAITTPAGTFAAGSQAALIDSRAAALATWTASGTGREIRLDRGAAGLEAIDRLIIPSGHNLATFTSISVDTDDNSGFTTPTTILAAVAVSAGVISLAMTSSTERYVRLTIAGTGTPELGELVYSRTRATAGVLNPEWTDERSANVSRFISRAGVEGRAVLGAMRRRFEFEFEWQSSTSDTLLSDLVTAYGAGASLWLDPPDDTEAPVHVVVADAVARKQDHPVPGAGTFSYSYSIAFEEVLG